MENAQQAGGGGVSDRSVCKTAVGWGVILCRGSSLYSSLVHFKAIYRGHGPRLLCPSMPHFIVGKTEGQGKEVTDSPSKAFLGIQHRTCLPVVLIRANCRVPSTSANQSFQLKTTSSQPGPFLEKSEVQ